MDGQTVQAFLNGAVPDNGQQSLLSFRAKASILYEKSAEIAARWTPRKRSSFPLPSLLNLMLVLYMDLS